MIAYNSVLKIIQITYHNIYRIMVLSEWGGGAERKRHLMTEVSVE